MVRTRHLLALALLSFLNGVWMTLLFVHYHPFAIFP